jgi:KDO2-lipid IV(A) lauroyltransferase
MHEIRSRWNTEQIEMQQTVRTLLRWKAEGEPFLCGFIQDQRPDVKIKDGITFLNQQTWYTPGAEEIAKKLNAELVYLDVERTSRGHYKLTFLEMVPDAEDCGSRYPMSRCFWRLLEHTIYRQPELWLWSHNRWMKWELSRALRDRIKDRMDILFKRNNKAQAS